MEASPAIRAEPTGTVASPPPQVQVGEPFTLVIFGATGALTSSKLLPALFRLWQGNFFSKPFAVVGVGRREKDNAQFRNELHDAAMAHDRGQSSAGESWERFAASVFYHTGIGFYP